MRPEAASTRPRPLFAATYAEPMRMVGIVVGVLAAIAGGVWIAQGLNLAFAPHSFMTSDRSWVAIGLVTLAAGIGLAAWSARRA